MSLSPIIRTTIFLVTAVGAVQFSIASLATWNTSSAHTAMHVTVATISAIFLVGKVRAVDHAVANSR